MSRSTIQFFTIVARNYLAHAFVLGDSVRQHHPEAEFTIFVMDDPEKELVSQIETNGFRVLAPEQIAIADYAAFVFKYNITEASTGVKPFVFQALFDEGAEQVLYLDPDIRCYRRFAEVLEALEHSAIVLTPHCVSPPPANQLPDDFVFLEAGAYNLGFIAIRRGKIAEQFLHWWSDRLLNWCLILKEQNLFVDQKWIDLVPAYFEKVLIFKSLAYNIAYWNFHERHLVQTAGVLTVSDSGEPVAFIHFSGIDIAKLGPITNNRFRSHFDLFDYRSKSQLTLADRPDLVQPFEEYAALLSQAGHARFSALPYAYGQYDNAELISALERTLFWTLARSPAAQAAPFATSPHSFYQLSLASGLRRNKNKKRNKKRRAEVRPPSAALEGEGRALLFFGGILRSVLRFLVRVLGPDAYVRFVRYLRGQLQPVHQRFMLKKWKE